jgi:signal transduction histidine kinase
MTKASFRFSPKILARLGEELNQTADQSIAELVKNAYDADALRCTIELVDVAAPGGTIVVSDDGDGMDAESIRDKWLVLGRSSKSSSAPTTSGRIPAGSKGLGRLAALRMGTQVVLQSIQRGNSRRLHELNIDWSKFESADVVEEVELDISSTKNPGGGHGTRTKLLGLRNAIGSEDLRRLARSLLLLTDPFGEEAAGFNIQLVSPEFKEIEALLKKKYFDDASFHLNAQLDRHGNAKARILDWQSNELAQVDLSGSRAGQPRKYEAPPATFDLWVFILAPGGEAFSARKSSKSEIQNWLRHVGGVHVYQDGIRVTPYGNPGNDWLEMNLARARSPEERPSTNTSIGRIQLRGSSPRSLRQKTDRSGFIEDQAFQELRAFSQDALAWLARWRLDLAEKRRAREKAEAPKAAQAQRTRVESAIAMAPPKVRKELEEAFVGYERTRDKEADSLRQEVQLYRTLSTAGITAATFSHESQGNPIKRIELGVGALKRRVPMYVRESERSKLLGPLQDIEKATFALATLGTATLSLVKAAKRRVGKVSVHEVLDQLLVLMAPFIAGMTTTVRRQFVVGNPYLRTSPAAVESVFANLINNSLAAFERSATANRIIQVSTALTGDFVEIRVSDSGPGITDVPLKDIWLPGITSRADGTGLGLTIVKDTVRDMGGEVEVVSPGPLGGAEFLVTLPILGS